MAYSWHLDPFDLKSKRLSEIKELFEQHERINQLLSEKK